ncbi:MAG TPA: (Fe-S)-binding protein [Geobacteraceae bacterium]|nr:(Fe-S)-binding protein [Geobacteraceae bacterium]
MSLLKSVEKEIRKCVKCGVCRAHCPVFTELGREPAVARGKVALASAVLSGKTGLDARLYDDMSKCLLCGTCVEKCPNDVPVDRIVMAAREALARKRGLKSFHKAVRQVLKRRYIMNIGALTASLLSPLIFRKVPVKSGLRLRLPLPFVGRDRYFPKIASKPFLSRYPEIIPGQPDKPRVLYFVGCMTNFIYTDIGDSAISLLRSLGCTIIIPKAQQCCGFPAISGGDAPTFADLAEKNIEIFEKYRPDHIVTACASCGSALRDLYPELLGELRPQLARRCGDSAGKVLDAVVLLHNLGLKPGDSGAGQKAVITYHDPCHLRRRGITKEPRDFLKCLPGKVFVEMEQHGSCCGLGGTFNVYHYGTSLAINSRKCDSIIKSGADLVVTGCPGCMMQIAGGLSKTGAKKKVLHTLELLSKSLKP